MQHACKKLLNRPAKGGEIRLLLGGAPRRSGPEILRVLKVPGSVAVLFELPEEVRVSHLLGKILQIVEDPVSGFPQDRPSLLDV
jgi:hypothetical protein